MISIFIAFSVLIIIQTTIGKNIMPIGSVISFKEDRGYGFIRPKDGDVNVYLHISALQDAEIETIKIGQRVSYDILSKDDKTSAINIKLLD